MRPPASSTAVNRRRFRIITLHVGGNSLWQRRGEFTRSAGKLSAASRQRERGPFRDSAGVAREKLRSTRLISATLRGAAADPRLRFRPAECLKFPDDFDQWPDRSGKNRTLPGKACRQSFL